jgi:hypothetical protein
LEPLSWRHRPAVIGDLEKLTNVRDWRASFDAERDLLTATARGNQGAYTIIMFQGSVSLVLARDARDIDLSKIFRDDDVGFKIHEVAATLHHNALEQIRALERLPELATRSITHLPNQECWHASSGNGMAYLYYRDGTTSIQVTCYGASGSSPIYNLKMQHSPDGPWNEVTEEVRSTPSAHSAVQNLLQKPIV